MYDPLLTSVRFCGLESCITYHLAREEEKPNKGLKEEIMFFESLKMSLKYVHHSFREEPVRGSGGNGVEVYFRLGLIPYHPRPLSGRSIASI